MRAASGAPIRTLAGHDKAPAAVIATAPDASKKPDPDGIIAICREAVEAGKSVLVFCATKKASQHCALLLASAVRDVVESVLLLTGMCSLTHLAG